MSMLHCNISRRLTIVRGKRNGSEMPPLGRKAFTQALDASLTAVLGVADSD